MRASYRREENFFENIDINGNKEEIIYSTKLHWINNVGHFIAIIIGIPFLLLVLSLIANFTDIKNTSLLFAVVAGIGSLFFLKFFLKNIYKVLINRSTIIHLTRYQLTLESGIFGKNYTDIPLRKYEGLSLHQSFLGKQLKYGTLYVTTGGITHCYRICNPRELRRYIIQYI